MQGDRHQITADHAGGDFGKALDGAFGQVFFIGRHYFQINSNIRNSKKTEASTQVLIYRSGANNTTQLATVIRITTKAKVPDPRPRYTMQRHSASRNITDPMPLLARV